MLSKINNILISSGTLGLHEKQHSAKILPVNKDDVVEGRIIRSIPPRHALILVEGKQVIARSSVNFDPGQLVLFKVLQGSPNYVLKLLELRHGQQQGVEGLLKKGSFGGFPFKFLTDVLNPAVASSEKSSQNEGADVLMRMGNLMKNISLRSDEMIRPEFLRSFIDGSGMSWEHKLRGLLLSGFESGNIAKVMTEQDLKGLALRLLAAGGGERLAPQEAMVKFADGLEQLQLLNLSGLEEKARLLLTLPMQLHGAFAYAQLLIDLADKRQDGVSEKDDNRVLKLSLFLEMSHLGPVRVDASVFQRAIRVGFVISNGNAEALFVHCAPLLKQQLERHGFSVQQVTCRLEEPNTLANTCLLDALIDPEEHCISLIV